MGRLPLQDTYHERDAILLRLQPGQKTEDLFFIPGPFNPSEHAACRSVFHQLPANKALELREGEDTLRAGDSDMVKSDQGFALRWKSRDCVEQVLDGVEREPGRLDGSEHSPR